MALARFGTWKVDERQQALLEDLRQAVEASGAAAPRSVRRAAWVAEWTMQQLAEWLAAIVPLAPLAEPADKLLTVWLSAAAAEQRRRTLASAAEPAAPSLILPAIEQLYDGLGPESKARGPLLAWLANSSEPGGLQLLAQLLVADPPQDDADLVQALAPLFQPHRRSAAAAMFPLLQGALGNPSLAAPVLDLANYLTREGIVAQHPLAALAPQLIELLGNLVHSLEQLEERPAEGRSPQTLSRQVASGVALAVSLCDALAQLGAPEAIGKLRQALTLRHRRVRTEAAAALAKLGDEAGRAELIQLAAQPVARLRVLAYAKELGLLEQIEPQFQTPLARAEAELCVWLAEPTQYGVPPAACEVYDQRLWRWPGFDEPVECFLFRFQYVVTVDGSERSYSNIGIAGPVTHAVLADLSDLPPDDIYALYAGWQAQHEDIREYDVARLSKSEQLEVERLKRRLHDAGYSHIEPVRMGYFFGDKALVAAVQLQGVPGIAIADFTEIAFFPHRHSKRPLGAEEAYSIYKGRKLLAAFNR